MIDSIIATYLRTNKRLVVLDFGAFIRKEGGDLTFVEFFRKDDGVLTALVGREYGIDKIEAREMIAKYVVNIRRTVDTTGCYVINGVGTLQANANGRYILEDERTTKLGCDDFLPNAEKKMMLNDLSSIQAEYPRLDKKRSVNQPQEHLQKHSLHVTLSERQPSLREFTVVQRHPIIPENISINKHEKIEYSNVLRRGDDFVVKFNRNLGDKMGNAVGNTVGCLVSAIIIVVVLALVGLILKSC